MNMLKHGCYFIGAVLLLLAIGMLVGYMIFYANQPDFYAEGTLVFCVPENADRAFV